jgi:hypothetical protein
MRAAANDTATHAASREIRACDESRFMDFPLWSMSAREMDAPRDPAESRTAIGGAKYDARRSGIFESFRSALMLRAPVARAG